MPSRPVAPTAAWRWLCRQDSFSFPALLRNGASFSSKECCGRRIWKSRSTWRCSLNYLRLVCHTDTRRSREPELVHHAIAVAQVTVPGYGSWYKLHCCEPVRSELDDEDRRARCCCLQHRARLSSSPSSGSTILLSFTLSDFYCASHGLAASHVVSSNTSSVISRALTLVTLPLSPAELAASSGEVWWCTDVAALAWRAQNALWMWPSVSGSIRPHPSCLSSSLRFRARWHRVQPLLPRRPIRWWAPHENELVTACISLR